MVVGFTTTYAISAFHPMLLPVALGYECKYKYEHDRPVANCNGLNLTSVPQNLSVNIVGLDLSQNNIHEIVNDSFAKYRNLVTLILKFLVWVYIRCCVVVIVHPYGVSTNIQNFYSFNILKNIDAIFGRNIYIVLRYI
jgi:hypothetical protein